MEGHVQQYYICVTFITACGIHIFKYKILPGTVGITPVYICTPTCSECQYDYGNNYIQYSI